MKQTFLRTEYNYDMNEASDASGLKCEDKTLTQQQYRDECDINIIAERFGLTGELPQVVNLPAQGDFSGVFDFQSAMNLVVKAREGFMEFPAKLRARFHNNPQEMLEFLNDEENKDEAIKLGLVNKPEPIVPEAPPQAPLAAAAAPSGATPQTPSGPK